MSLRVEIECSFHTRIIGSDQNRPCVSILYLSRSSRIYYTTHSITIRSALDSESEKLVQDALDRLLSKNNDMTTVVIAHRLQTVRNADCIVVIEGGQVKEQGTHQELLEKDGVYRRMVNRANESGVLPED